MATTVIYGIFRSDAGLGSSDAFQPGNSFSSDLATQITVDLGADATIFDGDLNANEVPNDTTQTYDDGSGAKPLTYDFVVSVTGSDGNTYQMASFDYDINNDGNFGDGFIGAADPGENNYFMAFLGTAPPPGITLTTTGIITDDSPTQPVSSFVPCFTSGTMIDTPSGEVAIDDLTEGALVLTEDNGAQPVRWIGSTKLGATDLETQPHLKPILIRADSLGQGYPLEDLLVSPQHRILVRSAIAQRIFGEQEVLVPAKKLTEISGVEVMQDNPQGVTYFHLLFDEHQIIDSNGAKTESLFTGPEALKAISPEARKEIETLFPKICGADFEPTSVRMIPEKGKLIKKLAQRHRKNGKAIYAEL